MTAARNYSSIAGEMELQSSISDDATTITVDTTTGLPGTTPFLLIIDPGTDSEELVDVTNVSGTTLTVVRGVDGSSNVAHEAGAKIRHGVSARDFREAGEHVGATANVHGVGASSNVVGTNTVQTLKNKDLSDSSNTFPSSLATDAELSAHASGTSTHGVSGNIVGTSDTQTLTNKTIDGGDNTLQNVPQSAVTDLEDDLSDHEGRISDIENNLNGQTTFVATVVTKDGKKIQWGSGTGTTNSNGQIQFAHSLGVQPSSIVVTPQQTPYQVCYEASNASNITIQLAKADGTPVSSGTTVGYSFFIGE